MRRRSIEALQDPAQLARLALRSASKEVRQQATCQIVDPNVLAEVACSDADPSVRTDAVFRLRDDCCLERVIRVNDATPVAVCAAKHVQGPDLLRNLATGAGAIEVRQAAIRNLKEESVLRALATRDPHEGVRSAAVKTLDRLELDCGDLLAHVVTTDPSAEVRLAAAERVAERALLIRVAIGDPDSNVRKMAASRISDEEGIAELARCLPDRELRAGIIGARLEDPVLLEEIAASDPDPTCREVARQSADRLRQRRKDDEEARAMRESGMETCSCCGGWFRAKSLDWKGRCGGCSGAS